MSLNWWILMISRIVEQSFLLTLKQLFFVSKVVRVNKDKQKKEPEQPKKGIDILG
jgi:hypothetical protein